MSYLIPKPVKPVKEIRRKSVFSKTSEIAEKFAEGHTKGSARQGRIFIEDDTIYSYGLHFPIARRINPNTFEFNTRKYSRTTSKQQSEVKRALENKGFTLVEKEL